MKEIEKDPDKWRDSSCSWIRRLSMVKNSVLPKLTYRFNAFLIKIPESYFVAIDKLILTSLWRGKGTQNSRHSALKENNVRRLTLP